MAAPTPRSRRLATRFYVLAVVFGVCLVAIRLGVLLANRDLRDASHLAEDSQRVLAAADAAQRLTVDLETGLRGWQLTGDRMYLEPTRRALVGLPVRMARLEALVRDDPVQRERVRRLRRQTALYGTDYIVPAITRPQPVRTRAQPQATTAEGKRRLDAIRASFAVFTAAEAGRAAERTAAARRSSDRAELVGIAGLVVLLAMLTAGVVYLARAVIAPVAAVAGAAARVARGDLSARVPPRGAGEVAQLGEVFNGMAAALETNRDELARAYRKLEHSKDQAILALSTPILEIDDRTLLLPLIGELGRERAEEIRGRLLDALRERRARYAVLDVTAVPAFDTDVARTLIQIVEAARLLGASVLVTGVSGELAQAPVGLGIDPGMLQTRADLRAGVAWATRRR